MDEVESAPIPERPKRLPMTIDDSKQFSHELALLPQANFVQVEESLSDPPEEDMNKWRQSAM